jgi:hypothetical protein
VVRRGISALVVEAMSKPAHRKASHVAQPAHPDGKREGRGAENYQPSCVRKVAQTWALLEVGRPRDWVELVARAKRGVFGLLIRCVWHVGPRGR